MYNIKKKKKGNFIIYITIYLLINKFLNIERERKISNTYNIIVLIENIYNKERMTIR